MKLKERTLSRVSWKGVRIKIVGKGDISSCCRGPLLCTHTLSLGIPGKPENPGKPFWPGNPRSLVEPGFPISPLIVLGNPGDPGKPGGPWRPAFPFSPGKKQMAWNETLGKRKVQVSWVADRQSKAWG